MLIAQYSQCVYFHYVGAIGRVHTHCNSHSNDDDDDDDDENYER